MNRISSTARSTMFSIFVSVGSFLIVLPAAAFSQGETTSAISGQVRDATNAAIPDATVTITNRENGLQRSLKSDAEGRFSFPQLKPGIYSVRVEVVGFDSQQN